MNWSKTLRSRGRRKRLTVPVHRIGLSHVIVRSNRDGAGQEAEKKEKNGGAAHGFVLFQGSPKDEDGRGRDHNIRGKKRRVYFRGWSDYLREGDKPAAISPSHLYRSTCVPIGFSIGEPDYLRRWGKI